MAMGHVVPEATLLWIEVAQVHAASVGSQARERARKGSPFGTHKWLLSGLSPQTGKLSLFPAAPVSESMWLQPFGC